MVGCGMEIRPYPTSGIHERAPTHVVILVCDDMDRLAVVYRSSENGDSRRAKLFSTDIDTHCVTNGGLSLQTIHDSIG